MSDSTPMGSVTISTQEYKELTENERLINLYKEGELIEVAYIGTTYHHDGNKIIIEACELDKKVEFANSTTLKKMHSQNYAMRRK